MNTYLSLDIGKKRTGAAISRSGIITEPLTSFLVKNDKDLIEKVKDLIEKNKITTLVVGLPKRFDGSNSNWTDEVQKIVERIKAKLSFVKIVTVNENLTSKEAERIGSRSSDRDALSAALILEQYFNEREN